MGRGGAIFSAFVNFSPFTRSRRCELCTQSAVRALDDASSTGEIELAVVHVALWPFYTRHYFSSSFFFAQLRSRQSMRTTVVYSVISRVFVGTILIVSMSIAIGWDTI